MKKVITYMGLGILVISLSACGSMRQPEQTTIPLDVVSATRLADLAGRRPPEPDNAASLWRSGPTSLFGDRRARDMGDIMTIVVEIDDEAEIQNSITANRSNQDQFSVNDLFGLPEWANGVLPGGATVSPAVDLERSRTASGDGSISRQEKITLRLAARVIDVLPNGHLVVAGTQEISVNYEARQLQVSGIVRPEDISRQNTITYDKIAEARIAYGGRGQITRTVAPKAGSRVLDKVIPF